MYFYLVSLVLINEVYEIKHKDTSLYNTLRRLNFNAATRANYTSYTSTL